MPQGLPGAGRGRLAELLAQAGDQLAEVRAAGAGRDQADGPVVEENRAEAVPVLAEDLAGGGDERDQPVALEAARGPQSIEALRSSSSQTSSARSA